jgi:hypothetical protein
MAMLSFKLKERYSYLQNKLQGNKTWFQSQKPARSFVAEFQVNYSSVWNCNAVVAIMTFNHCNSYFATIFKNQNIYCGYHQCPRCLELVKVQKLICDPQILGLAISIENLTTLLWQNLDISITCSLSLSFFCIYFLMFKACS